MINALEIALMVVGLFALAWVILSPNAGIIARLIAIVFGIAAIIAARVLDHEHREDRR